MHLDDFRAAYRAPAGPKRWLALLTALSLASICYLRVWDILFFDAGKNYFAADVLRSRDYLAALCNLAVLTGGFSLLLRLTWRNRNRWVRAAGMGIVLAAFSFPLDFLRRAFVLGGRPVVGYAMMAVVIALLFAATLRWRQRFMAGLLIAVTFFWPFAVFNVLHIFYRMVAIGPDPDRSFLSATASPTVKTGGMRVFLIVFDEWDQSMLLERRPRDLALPWLDRLRSSSVTGLNTWPPTNATLTSIPSLLTGQIVGSAQAAGNAELRAPGGEAGKTRDVWHTDSVVTDASNLGLKSAILGWYHPYGRVFPSSPWVEASSFGFPSYQAIRKPTLPATMLAQLEFLAYPSFVREAATDLIEDLQRQTLARLRDPSISFGFFHYGIPHGPGIFDRHTMRYASPLVSNTDWYAGNLKLVDLVLGHLLDGLRESGLDERTTLILTSDHWWRMAPWAKPGEGYRVPLFIRFGTGGSAVTMDESLCTVSLRPVIADILAGTISTQADLIAALRGHATTGKIRYVNGIAQLAAENASAKSEKTTGNSPD